MKEKYFFIPEQKYCNNIFMKKEENEKMGFNGNFFKRSKYESKKENRAIRKIFNPDFQKILL